MKFKLKTLENVYNYEDKAKLEKYGFEFEKGSDYWFKRIDQVVEVELCSISDLVKITDDLQSQVIFDGDTVIIYDGYYE